MPTITETTPGITVTTLEDHDLAATIRHVASHAGKSLGMDGRLLLHQLAGFATRRLTEFLADPCVEATAMRLAHQQATEAPRSARA